MTTASVCVLSSSRLMSFLVAILAFVGVYYDYCYDQRSDSGRLQVVVAVVVVVAAVVNGGGNGILHGCL